ncbi:MAG: alpha/beta hydrolase [Clostridia bacterium]|nr:alpha/beta hydrolase [Clostridia bacterium]
MLETKEWELDTAFPGCTKGATLYYDTNVPAKAVLLYFHGGGLLYGSRNDLPELHRELLTQAGYPILAFDYLLAPACKLDDIYADVRDSIDRAPELLDEDLPFFLFGRSAGAWMMLITAVSGTLKRQPAGVLSYYGYGFLVDHWYETPSPYYQQFPAVGEDCLKSVPDEPHTAGSLDAHYNVYVYARQSGNWKKLLYTDRDKFFYLNYSLRLAETFPVPLFAAHATGDPDVPYKEFFKLCNRYHPSQFVAPADQHDFDRNEDSEFTHQLLQETIAFLDAHVT